MDRSADRSAASLPRPGLILRTRHRFPTYPPAVAVAPARQPADDPLRADDRPHERRLAATARAQQTGDRSACDVERDAVEHLDAAADHAQVAHRDGKVVALGSHRFSAGLARGSDTARRGP